MNRVIVHPNGKQEWWLNRKRHREDGPAIIWPSGSEEWYYKGALHRVDGPAIILSNGQEEWWVNGERHRLDGPAIIYNGRQDWYINGKRHRIDGPAVIYPDDWREWCINDKNITNEVRNWMKKQNITWPWDWNEETQAQFILTFC